MVVTMDEEVICHMNLFVSRGTPFLYVDYHANLSLSGLTTVLVGPEICGRKIIPINTAIF